MRQRTTDPIDLLATLREAVASLSPLRLWEALQEAEEGICLMAVPVRTQDRRIVKRR